MSINVECILDAVCILSWMCFFFPLWLTVIQLFSAIFSSSAHLYFLYFLLLYVLLFPTLWSTLNCICMKCTWFEGTVWLKHFSLSNCPFMLFFLFPVLKCCSSSPTSYFKKGDFNCCCSWFYGQWAVNYWFSFTFPLNVEGHIKLPAFLIIITMKEMSVKNSNMR